MNLLDTRTVLLSYIVSNAICAAVMASLWFRNRRRFPGLGYWLADFILQLVAVLLIALRGLAPDFVSILLGSPLIMGGTLLLYMGLERYVGQVSSQRHNYLLLAVYIGAHAYFTFAQPSLPARNIIFSLALLGICAQCAWLLLRRVAPDLRPDTRLVGVMFGAYSLVSLVRIGVDWTGPQGNELFKSGLFDTLVILVFQMLFIGLTFGLFLMVNRRLFEDVHQLASFPESNPNPVLAIGKAGAITFINPAVPAVLERIGASPDARAFMPADIDDILRKLARGEPAKLYREVTLGSAAFGEDIYLLPQFAAAHIYVRDITELKLAEEKLITSEGRYRRLFEAAKDGILILDAETGLIVDVNPFLIEMLGFPAADFHQKKIWELGLFKDIVANQANFLELQQKKYIRSENLPLKTADGRQISVEFVSNVYQVNHRKVIQCNIRDITERKRAEERLDQTLERLRLATHAAHLGIWDWDISRNELVWDDHMYELFGVKRADFPDAYDALLAGVHPDDRAARDEVSRQAQRGEGEYDTEFRVLWPDGTLRVLKAYGQAVRDAAGQPLRMTGVNYDITERKLAENIIHARLRLIEFAAHHSLDDLLQKTLDEVCALTDSPIGFYHFVAPDQKTLSLQAWSTRTLKEFCTAAGKDMHYSVEAAGVWADCVRQRRPVIHNDYASLPGRKGLPEGHAQVTRELVVPILREDRVVAVLGIGNRARPYLETDIDLVAYLADVAWEIVQRKRAEEALQAYSEELEERVGARTAELRDAQAQLVSREKLALLGQMSAGIAHELRQPLAVISNAVYFLQAAQPDAAPTVKEYLGLITAELQTADHIVTDLLSFARARAAEKEPAALAGLVEQALARNPAPAGIAVQAALPPNLPPVVVDPRQLGQVLNNLITNAYQAMPRGGQLTLAARPSAAGFVSLAVTDTGDGIAPENMPKLFEPLFTTKTKGTGLGLTVTKVLVEANGGAIEVTSETGRGATFQLTLPAKEEPV